MTIESITVGGGCFWCVEAVYVLVRGVQSVESGYSNGHTKNPTYEQVCSGNTGHVEVLKVQFDSEIISLKDILNIFFAIHDPTTLNRQGNDVGTQYRSGIYYENAAQAETAKAVMKELVEQKVFDQPIITELKPLENYSAAEGYHQNYYANHPEQGYCSFVVAPKVAKFRKSFAHWMKV